MVNVVAIDLRFPLNDIFNINGKSVWEISIADLENNEVKKKVFMLLKILFSSKMTASIVIQTFLSDEFFINEQVLIT